MEHEEGSFSLPTVAAKLSNAVLDLSATHGDINFLVFTLTLFHPSSPETFC